METKNAELQHRPSHKRKRSASASSYCFSCCFHKRKNTTPSISNNDVVSSENHQLNYDRPPPRLIRTSSTWLKSRISDLPEIRDRYKNIVSKLSRTTQRRRHASDFSYDAFSYALNFDDGLNRADESLPPRCFSARLPPTTTEESNAAADEVNVSVESSPKPIGEVSSFKFQIGD